MKKNITYILCLSLLGILTNCVEQDDSADRLPIKEQTFLVYRRYYFVARLDKTIQLLAKMYQEVSAMQDLLADKQITFDEIVPQETYRLFTHKQIRRSVKEIAHTRSLKPLFMVWDSFKSYKSLHDDLLVEDFSKEIFIITRNTIDSLHKHDTSYVRCAQSPLSLEAGLDALSDMTHLLESSLSGGSRCQTLRAGDIGDIHLAVHTDEVAFRFYCVRRLRNALDYLLSLPEADRAADRLPARKALAHVWDDVSQYKHIDNERFVHGFAVYTLMLLHCQVSEQRMHKSLSQADLVAMQHQIEQLPLEEILQAIDLIVKQVHNAVDHYHKSGLTFGQWIKRYWWAPPLIFSTVAIKCFLLYYKNFRTSA